MNRGWRPESCIIARVIVAGVGQPVGVLGLLGWLVITPLVISSASRTGVRRVFSGPGPAPEIPGTVDSRVFAKIPAKRGLSKAISGFSERNPIGISEYRYAAGLFQDIALHHSTTI
jgi:hypothetical protein